MATISEDYVSYETARLLKEKWFKFIEDKDELAKAYIHAYTKEGKEVWGCYSPDYYPCITINMAMKWLREVHNLCIEPYRTASGYLYTISKIWTGSEIYSDEFNGDDEASGQWTTYEKAVENAIKYCLEHLI